MSKNGKERKMMKVRRQDYELFKGIAENDGVGPSKIIDAVSAVCEDWKKNHGSELRQLLEGLDDLKEIPDDPDKKRAVTTLKYATKLIYERGNGARERLQKTLEEIDKDSKMEADAKEEAREKMEGVR